MEKAIIKFNPIEIHKKNQSLLIFLPKMSAYRKDFDETKYVSFLIKDDKLLEKCYGIQEKVSNAIKKEFDSNPVYNKNT